MEEINIKSENENEVEDGYVNYDMGVGNAQFDGDGHDDSEMEGRKRKFDFNAPNDIQVNEGEGSIQYYDDVHAGNIMERGNSTQQQQQQFDFTGNAAAGNSIEDRGGNNIKFEFTAGYRRNSVLIYLIDEKQLFTKKYTHNSLDRYTCYNKACKASLSFDTYLNKILKLHNTVHTHPDQSDIYKKMKVLNEMKDYCLTDSGLHLTTKQIFDQKCNVMKDAAHLVEYDKIKRNLNRLKKCALQKPNANSNNYVDVYGMFSNDLAALTNDFAMKWDAKIENRPTPARVSSPFSSDNESLLTESNSSNVNPTATSAPAPAPNQTTTNVQQQPSKKMKFTQEVPCTDGFLDESTYESVKPSSKKSPPPRTMNPRPNPRPNPQPNPRVYNEPDTHTCSSCPCISAQESEHDKIGRAWASELKKMTPEQQIFAKRAIAEIIFEGQLGSLNRDSVQVNRVHRTTRNVDDPLVEEEFVCQKN